MADEHIIADDDLGYDPWDERDAYLEEGHDELEVSGEVVVEADTGEEVVFDG